MPIGYDKSSINRNILLDLPFREGKGAFTRDIAKPARLLTLNEPGGGSFTWGNLASGCPYLLFTVVGTGIADGVYLDCPAVDTDDLDFVAGDFSIACWINWESSGGTAQYIIGRGAVDTDGWDVYLDISGGRNTVSQRHHHAGIGGDNSNCFSVGWTPGIWWLLGITRIGGNLYPVHYRNGIPLEMDYGGATMLDPTTAIRDLVIGARHTKTSFWYRNMMWRPRAWGRALHREEWLELFHREQHLIGI